MAKPFRAAHLAALHFMIISLVPSSAPSNPAGFRDHFTQAPSAEEIELFEELVDWIGEDNIGRVGGDGSPRDVIRSRPTSFDVFRSYHEEPLRYRPLETVPYGFKIRRVAEKHGVDGLLVAAIVETESSFNPQAVSHRGAVGLMQVMPAYQAPADRERLADPDRNLELGVRYLRYLLERYGGDMELALAAYNAGPGNVRRYGGVPPFRETRNFVDRVLSIYIGYHQQVWRDNQTAELLGLSGETGGGWLGAG